MRVGVIRTVGRLFVHAYAGAIEPRLDIAVLPDSPAGTFGVALSTIISTVRVLAPIQRQALAHKPFAEIGAVDRPGRDRPAIGVEAEGRAISRTTGTECVKVVCCLHPGDPKRESESALGRPRSLLIRRAQNPSPSLSPLASTIGRGDRNCTLGLPQGDECRRSPF